MNHHPIFDPPPTSVPIVYLDDPDEAFQQQLAAANYRAQRQILNTGGWFDYSSQVDPSLSEIAQFSPSFWIMVRLWALILILALTTLWYITGAHTMSNPPNNTPPAAAPPESKDQPKGQPHGHSLQAQIKRFGDAVVAVATHPDNGMFFFDAQDLTVNDKLNTLKIRALIDTLCAAGLIERHRFENRLEELVTQTADKLVEGANRLAITARVMPPGPINGSGH